MALPSILKGFNLFHDGVSFVGQCLEVELPKLSRKMEAYRSGGMDAEIEVDQGMEKLELGHNYAGFMKEILEKFGITSVGGVLLRFAGSYEREDTGEVDAVEITVRGRHKEIDFGNAKAGDKTDFKVKSTLSYYKLSVNGSVLIEIDILNMICIVNGVDLLAERRAALGL